MKPPTPSLFWRTFFWIVALIVAILLAWAQSFRLFEREPRARQIAQQVVSIVNITRSALLYSDPAFRRELLADLAENEASASFRARTPMRSSPFPTLRSSGWSQRW